MFYQILALCIWASSLVAGKYAFTMLDPVLTVQVRLIIISFLIFPLFLRHWKKVDKHWRSQLWWLGFINYPVIFLLQFIGLKYTSAASAVTIIGLEPLLIVFIGHFFFQDKACWYHWLFGVIAFLGVAMLIIGGGDTGEISLLGCGLVLLAGICFSASLRWTKKMITHITAPAYTAISVVLGAITCLPFTLLLTQDWQINWNWQGIAGLLYLSIFCSWIAYWLWNKGLNATHTNLTGLLTALEPIFGVFLAIILLGESISLLSWFGIVVIISATLIASLMPKLSKK
ncbi:DMT family transporter [Pasteurella canis]|uniref:Membrane protein n=1 Tax=Pasteurella canis TaxID=753 RepID=A0ABQ4VH98_9PAST|nr:DMT family transporter [Pasteurella canis]UAX41859.1 DMT family transporter [Pasteurella canis]UEC22948.1 DMT family transporter [Pasteurella canis]GJH43411.1 membrane protein [Pasteurella canis]